MPTDAPITSPKKKLRISWWIGGFFLLLFMLFLFQLVGPSPPIIVSKDTTYVTEPLLDSGLPDYEAYMRAKLREGVTPENNAAVLLMQALGPGDLAAGDFKAVAAEIGLDKIPSADAVLQPLYGEANRKRVLKWLPKPKPADDGTEIEPDADEIIGAAQSAAWTSQQLPPLAEWVEANKAPIDLLVEASRRPRFYSPSPSLLNNTPEMMLAMDLPGIQSNREAARVLAARATWHVGENRLEEAWQDNLAIYRLSALFAQGSSLVDQLVAIAIRGMAIHITTVVLSSDHMTKELAQQIQKDLATLPPAKGTANCVDQGERAFGLNAVLFVRSSGLGAIEQLSSGKGDSSPLGLVSIDWNVVLRRLNAAYDKAANAMRRDNYDERKAAFVQFENEVANSENNIRRPGSFVAAALSRQSRSNLVGTFVTSLLLPALTAASDAEDRTNTQFALVELAASVAAYHAEHGAYPEKLYDLVPKILPSLPVDLYHAKPFMYRRIDDGYLLYTLGPNGTDDGGSNEQMSVFEGRELDGIDPEADAALRDKIPAGADDISIRLPVPPFKLPAPPAPDSATAQ
jgi:hypothetical protein